MPPFTYDVKREVKERVGLTDGKYTCELTGRTDRPTEIMHEVHGEGPLFNRKENAKQVTDLLHLGYHLYFYDMPERIGLNKKKNIGAINLLSARVTQASWGLGTVDQLDEEITNALEFWKLYFEEHELPSQKRLLFSYNELKQLELI